jgi:hypothetical protein
MHFVLASTWGTRSLRYRENSRGTEASGKPNRTSFECVRAPLLGFLLVTWARAGRMMQCARGLLGAGYTTIASPGELV